MRYVPRQSGLAEMVRLTCGDAYEREEAAFREDFAANLVALLDSQSISRKELSYMTGISKGTLANYAHGKTLPDIANLRRIARCLQVSAFDLIGF